MHGPVVRKYLVHDTGTCRVAPNNALSETLTDTWVAGSVWLFSQYLRYVDICFVGHLRSTSEFDTKIEK